MAGLSALRMDLGDNKFSVQDVLVIVNKLKGHPKFLNLRLSDVHFGAKMDDVGADVSPSLGSVSMSV